MFKKMCKRRGNVWLIRLDLKYRVLASVVIKQVCFGVMISIAAGGITMAKRKKERKLDVQKEKRKKERKRRLKKLAVIYITTIPSLINLITTIMGFYT